MRRSAPRAPMLLPPSRGMGYRVVLDLYPTTESKFEETAGWPADLRPEGRRRKDRFGCGAAEHRQESRGDRCGAWRRRFRHHRH